MREVRISLQSKQRQFMKAIEDYSITLFGGARGGGKSYALRNIILLRRFMYPKSTGAIFRKTYPELEANHIRPLFNEHPYLREFYNESKKVLSLPNGSILRFCHCESEKDVSIYQGQEIHDLGIDEIGQWSEGMFRTLMGSNRSASPGIKARCMMTANPGGVGHAWLKRLFVEKRYKERERPQDYHFIQSLISDNKALIDTDPEYIHRLNAEPNEALRKAYLYGDWDVSAGQYFSEIQRDVHVIKPFTIPEHWTRFGAYDFGFNHPAAFGWFAVDEDGNVYLYRELVKAQMRIDQFAQELNKFEDTAKLYPIVAGHDCWAKKGVMNETNPPTIAEEFTKHNIYLKRAVIDRIQGASQLRNYLAWQGRPGNKPRFFIFENCPISYETIARMIYDPDRPEDVLKVDSTDGNIDAGDDAYDMVRYGLMSRPLLSDVLKVVHPWGTPEWHEAEAKRMEQEADDYFAKQLEDEKYYLGQ